MVMTVAAGREQTMMSTRAATMTTAPAWTEVLSPWELTVIAATAAVGAATLGTGSMRAAAAMIVVMTVVMSEIGVAIVVLKS